MDFVASKILPYLPIIDIKGKNRRKSSTDADWGTLDDFKSDDEVSMTKVIRKAEALGGKGQQDFSQG